MTRLQLAQLLCVHPATVSNWEFGATSPNLRLLPKVLNYLGRDPRTASTPEALGVLLRRARTAAGLSIEELASTWSVDPTTIWKWEHGRTRPRIQHRARIRELTGTNQLETEAGQNLRDRIRAFRERHGLLQKDLARMFGAKQQDVSRWERGRRSKEVSGLERLLGAIGEDSQCR